MSTNQLFLGIAGLVLTLAGFLKYYIDAKIDPMATQVSQLVNYLILHEGKISTLEERTKKL